jgi:mRNA-degrading endonuclease RelE of RelBE toxin-antitoxin system
VLHAVLETSIFSRRADALLSAEDRAELIKALASNPMAGDVMPGLGGVRKLRFAPKGRGKSGGFRVIYYVLTESQPILALLIYGKNEQGDLSPAQRKVVAALAAEMKQGAGS